MTATLEPPAVHEPAAGPPAGYSADACRQFKDSFRVTDDGHWEWTGRIGSGGQPILNTKSPEGKKAKISAARLSFCRYARPLAEGENVRRTCTNPKCVNPSHLTAKAPTDEPRRTDPVLTPTPPANPAAALLSTIDSIDPAALDAEIARLERTLRRAKAVRAAMTDPEPEPERPVNRLPGMNGVH